MKTAEQRKIEKLEKFKQLCMGHIKNKDIDFWAKYDVLQDELISIDKEIEQGEDEKCPNCKETISPCACMRNICIRCGKPVGNITFTICDDCWNLEHSTKADTDKRKRAEKALIDTYGCKDIEDLKKCFLNPNDVSITMIIDAMLEFNQQSEPKDEVKDIINCIIAFDPKESLKVKGKYFEVIQRDLLKALQEPAEDKCVNCPSNQFYLANTERIMNEQESKEPQGAEKILEPFIRMANDNDQYPFPYVRPSCAIKAMEQHHKAMMPSDLDIERWASGRVNEIDPDKYGYGDLLIEGAKWVKYYNNQKK